MKVLVVFFSHSGNTRLVGESLAESLNADTFNLKTGKERYLHGVTTFVRGGAEALMGYKPKLDQIPDMNSYDAFVIGSPVWAWTVSPPVASFLDCCGEQLRNKKTALFCTFAGNSGKAISKMECYLSLKNIISKKRFCFGSGFDEISIMNEISLWSSELNNFFGGENE